MVAPQGAAWRAIAFALSFLVALGVGVPSVAAYHTGTTKTVPLHITPHGLDPPRAGRSRAGRPRAAALREGRPQSSPPRGRQASRGHAPHRRESRLQPRGLRELSPTSPPLTPLGLALTDPSADRKLLLVSTLGAKWARRGRKRQGCTPGSPPSPSKKVETDKRQHSCCAGRLT